MTWRELLTQASEPAALLYPWTGGRELRVSGGRRWTIDGKLPPEHGWWAFSLTSRRRATFQGPPVSELAPVESQSEVAGWLAGDRLVSDGPGAGHSAPELVRSAERVRLIPRGLDRFQRVRAGRFHEEGQLVFLELEMPLGPEQAVLDAYLEHAGCIEHVPGVTPGLAAVFRLETWRRDEERKRREQEERLAHEARRRETVQLLGDGAGRRFVARVDFGAAARAALAVGGAEYLDHRYSEVAGEMVVRFRLNGSRFECTCDALTLQIRDSGICLHAEWGDDDFEYGTSGDTWLTLESLPGVIQDAERQDRLVIFRHA